MAFLLPKGYSNVWGIGIIDGICNTMLGEINRRIEAGITYYDIINGLQAGKVTRTASLESKLLQ